MTPEPKLTKRDATAPASRLARKLGTFDAVVMGLGSMIGAGIFAALGPAARAAGTGLMASLAIAAFVAYCNATSSAELASRYPESGGAYAYGRKRLGAFWGFLAGWAFVVGKIASCAAMALTFANYAAPAIARGIAVAAIVGLTAINWFGIAKTALATRAIVTFVLACLALVVFAAAAGGGIDVSRVRWSLPSGTRGVLEAAGLLFFAFAGYARIATLGEEVVDPARTIPRAIPLALAIVLLVYALVAVSALLTVDVAAIARSSAPLIMVVESGRFASFAPAVRIGAAVASLGVMLTLLAGIGRTAFAMASNRDLPHWLASIHPRHRVPGRAELAIGAIVVALALVIDEQDAIGLSSCSVLVYYAIANASALTLAARGRRWPRALAFAGLAGCVLLAASLPPASVITGIGLLSAGGAVYAMRRTLRKDPVDVG